MATSRLQSDRVGKLEQWLAWEFAGQVWVDEALHAAGVHDDMNRGVYFGIRAVALGLGIERQFDHYVILRKVRERLGRRRRQQIDDEATTTPEDTLREAGISTKRQAKYQRRMSSLLACRQFESPGK
jgi:hypothetical protein